MNAPADFKAALEAWAGRERSVAALVLFGSRERDPADAVWRPDAVSDWDLQAISRDTLRFATPAWTRGLGAGEPRLYVKRRSIFATGFRVDAVFDGPQINLLVFPAAELRLFRCLMALGVHRCQGWVRHALAQFAHLVRPGWRFLKDAGGWERMYRRALAEIPDPRLSDEKVIGMADGFVSDHRWACQKLARGELLAAQRMLHQELAETNFWLLYECRLRSGERAFERARRLERTATAEELACVRVSAVCEPAALAAALEASAEGCRRLMRRLVGERWAWPMI